jgi:hypothetical protein
MEIRYYAMTTTNFTPTKHIYVYISVLECLNKEVGLTGGRDMLQAQRKKINNFGCKTTRKETTWLT